MNEIKLSFVLEAVEMCSMDNDVYIDLVIKTLLYKIYISMKMKTLKKIGYILILKKWNIKD